MTPVAPLRLAGVGQEYGTGRAAVRALDGIDLDLRPGELLAVMGPSGSGKSSLLAIAGGLEVPTEGRVEVDGVDIIALDPAERATIRRRSIGYVFQNYNLIPSLSAVENAEMPLQLDGASPRAARAAALAALDEVHAADLAGRFPEELSGGQQQLVAIARALVGRRAIILADEPTGALDSVTGEQVMIALRDHIDAGAAGILVTHEARFAAWADRTVFLRDGRIVDRSRDDSIADLLTRP
ncbi:ABC transporter ATP-binding protein [Actinomyces sp. B33]|uniref:ABC transporter ATP-binding protein n=1 Tax=Actinomyces sp. B33 TaxID=2942131 RepID=UPI002340BB5F|nr:ABC transporter ATP-binding protein [Actinomyces sp. B33]MDC4232283.1 ABC transporter ATP-binding protein [Actinomyces sp. B33]